MEPLSVFVTTFNNERTLSACLESVQWADEILLLDSFSEDDTLAIARRFGCTIHQQAFQGFGPQKLRAMELTRNRWVLLLDADEALTPELQQEIRRLMTAGPRQDGYEIRRIEQHYWRMSSLKVRSDYFMRLFDKTRAAMTENPVHARPKVEGKVSRLRSHFLHFGMPMIHGKVRKINDYSSRLVRHKVSGGKRGNPWMCVFYPPVYFLRQYLVDRQIFNGWVGFFGSAISAFYVFLKYAKLYEHFQFETYGERLLPEGAPSVDRLRETL